MSGQILENPTRFSPRSPFRPTVSGRLGPVLMTLDATSLVGAALLAQACAAYLSGGGVDPLRLAAIAAFPTAFALPLMALCGTYDPDAAWRPAWAVKALMLVWPGLLPFAWLLTAGLQIHLDIADDGLFIFALMGPAALVLQRYAFFALLRRSVGQAGSPLPQRYSRTGADVIGLDAPARPGAGTTPGPFSPTRAPLRRSRTRTVPVPESRPADQGGRRRTVPRLASAQRIGIDLESLASQDGQAIKRLFDLAGAGLLCVLLAPLLIFIALLIRATSEGPVLFRQLRGGLHGQPFAIYKFRTMTVQAEEAAVRQALRHDPRVTPLGRVLRRTSLDELPQLLNVLRGEMSLVGPRPHALDHDREFALRVAGYHRRHQVKPGMTGWAQVCGCRGETRTEEALQRRIALDLTYIERRSLWFDLRIIVRTCREVVSSQTAF